MQAAPAVTVACHDRGAWQRVTALLLAIASMLAWASTWIGMSSRAANVVAVLVGLGVLALAWRRRPATSERLSWDGQCWRLDDMAAGRRGVSAVFDLGTWILVRFDAQRGPGQWRALSEGGVGPGWRGLRLALFTAAPGHPRISA